MDTTRRFARVLAASTVCALVIVLAACGSGAPTATNLPSNTAAASPQAVAATCPQIVKTALETIGTRCNDIGSNQVCYGNARLDVTPANDKVVFKAPGDRANLSDLKTLHTTQLDVNEGTWGIAVMRAAVNLPGTTAGQQVTFLMYGDTTLDSFSPDMTTVSFRTNIGPQACDEVPPSGLTVQVPHGQRIKFNINGADISLGSTAILQAVPDSQLTVNILEGQGQVSSGGVTRTVDAGLQVQVPMKGAAVSAPPSEPRPIPLKEVSAAPVQLLSEPISMTQVATVVEAAIKQATLAPTATTTPVGPASTATPVTPGTPQASITPLLTWTPGPTLSVGNVSGGSNRIAFASNRDGNWEIYVMNADGSSPVRLTNHPQDDRSPSWSPDGKRITFSSYNGQVWQIFVVNDDGSGLTALTQTDQNADHAVWSPDGAHIAYDSLKDSNRDIWTMDANGANAHALAGNPADDSQPAWSPDGAHIAFVSMRDGNKEIYVMNADGSSLTRLTDNPTEDRAPVWSPDGKRIAFVSNRAGNDELYVMDADGKNVQRLTSNLTQEDSPTWSPDGAQIAYVSNKDGAQAIYVMNADGDKASIHRLTDLSSDSNNPAWQR